MIGDPISGEWYHAIPVTKLRELLDPLPGSWILQPNGVKNLAILNLDGDYLGYVDLGEEEVEIF